MSNLTVQLLAEMIDLTPPTARKPKAVAVRDLPEAEMRAYKARKQAERRAALKTREANGSVKLAADTTREALADAALMLLASGAPGSDAISAYLKKVFHDQAGAEFTIRTRARAGQLKPKLLHIAAKSS